MSCTVLNMVISNTNSFQISFLKILCDSPTTKLKPLVEPMQLVRMISKTNDLLSKVRMLDKMVYNFHSNDSLLKANMKLKFTLFFCKCML